MTILETERLRLRRLSLDDAAFIVELLNEPSFLHFVGDKGVRTLDDARDYILTGPMASYEQHGFGLYLVELKERGIPMGICGLLKRDASDDVDVGFGFLPAFWLQGYAFESTSAAIAYGRRALGLNRIVAVTESDNAGSIKTLEMLLRQRDGPHGDAFELRDHCPLQSRRRRRRGDFAVVLDL